LKMLTRKFAEILKDLEPVEDLDNLRLTVNGEEVGVIPNAEGKRGSLAVYAHIVGHKEGVIGFREAIYGLGLFAEHTDDARENPGKHPNVDLLLDVLDKGYEIEVEVNYRAPSS
jgi:hypothetical protein